ncbi:MAG TPA: PQQ-binding-like beta-propeller repeat protein [Solirubrobacterales bacterium]|nr:PQQ-binding-like beta-propeller repeat protein [Solirubrobacterales bacterium]
MENRRPSSAKLAVLGLGALLTGAVVAFVVGYLIGHETGPTKTTTETVAARAAAPGGETVGDIAPAPAFSAEELAADPRENWITNGGSLSNARYSPLDEIDSDNVGELKGEWITHLNGSGEATKYSAEAQPIVYQGVMYVVTGADDVFAVDVETGKKLWVYEAKMPPQIDTICCGWTNRGVALGEGMVFLGQLDGTLVALDQKTGAVKWKATIGRWQNGETITNAPLYYNGRVYTGLSGGEFGIRGRLTAVDAKSGKVEWKFWTIPGPGETGHETWEGGDSWKKGGAPIWNTPAVDPELNMLYFSTGNASPDLNGSGRPGENLFAASIVAIDATTGKYKWHFQEVHHDIWDYDAPSPVVLWNGKVDGEEVKGLSQPGKTGWLYMLDRETGKPIHGIVEKKVPQDKKQQATWETQPYPLTDSFVPHNVTEGDFEEIEKLAEDTFQGKGKLTIDRGEIFDPFAKDAKVVAPGPSGGTNWPPSSYNRNTNDVYICGISSYAGYMTEGLKPVGAGEAYLSSVLTLTGFGTYDGTLTAQDVNTGKIDWQREFEGESCYSGTVTTAGNLVFVGRSTGELVAYDAESGDELWSFQTGAGANTTPTVFEWQGKEYLAFYAGGNSLAASAHGDNLWLFSLDGEMEEVEGGGKAEQGQHAGEETPQAEVEESEGKPAEAAGGGKEGKENVEEESSGGNAAAGKMVFDENCSVCHGATGHGGNGGPDLTTQPKAKSLNGSIEQVTEGGGGMPAFAELLSTKEIEDVAAYVVETINGK